MASLSSDAMEVDNDEQDEGLKLLERTTAIMEAEISLTRALEKVEPWLKNATVNPHHSRVRPIPSTIEEAKAILAVARNLSNRTSAPAGWNPMAPICNFATPNPLPNLLRGGALAALQLERAKQQVESVKKRTIEEQSQAEKQKQRKEEEQERPAAQQPRQQQQQHQHRRAAAPQQTQKPIVSMNLSDSSSSDEDDDE